MDGLAPDPGATPRARRRARNRERILEEARRLALEGGFEAVSLHALAAALDYTAGALYRYFPSRDALLAAVVGELLAGIEGEVARAVAGGRTPLGRVRRAAEAWAALARDDPRRFALVSTLLASPGALLADDAAARGAVEAMMRALAPLAAALEAAAASGALAPGDPSERALLLFAGVHGTQLLRKQAARAPGLLDPDRLHRAMVRALLAAWAHGPRRRTRR